VLIHLLLPREISQQTNRGDLTPLFILKENKMTLKELKKKVLGLIEELNPTSDLLTKDNDIAMKLNDVINQIMFEMCRIKKIPKYIEMEVSKGDLIDFAQLEKECGYEVYQVALVSGVNVAPKANGSIYKVLESGTAEVELYVYPERITDKTNDNYEFELSADVLEVMPYGIAGDLLKTDVSANYGSVYSSRYEQMLNRLDTRNQLFSISIEGGY
jgi:hypothetical protein